MTDVISASGLYKGYREGGLAVEVLKGVDLTLAAGEIVAVVGASGSGKSTLLHCLGGLDDLDAGSVKVGGRDLARLSDEQRGDLRNRSLGFVYQFHHLLPEFTALDNVAMPLAIRRRPLSLAREQAAEALAAVGLTERADHRPDQLSGGERQRVALARATIMQPEILLADEPTGNLDTKSGKAVLGLLEGMNRDGLTLIVVTHDPKVAQRADRILLLVDGRIERRVAAAQMGDILALLTEEGDG